MRSPVPGSPLSWSLTAGVALPPCAQIQQRLIDIAGKEAVQSAILHILRQPLSSAVSTAHESEARAPSPAAERPGAAGPVGGLTDAPGLASGQPSSTNSANGAPTQQTAGQVASDLRHAAFCTADPCDQPNCARLKVSVGPLAPRSAPPAASLQLPRASRQTRRPHRVPAVRLLKPPRRHSMSTSGARVALSLIHI